MSAHFTSATCKLDGDAYVSHLAWSKVDVIAALAASTVDDNDRETHQVIFISNEAAVIPHSAISHEYEATTFDWQPNGRVLAIGWADGNVYLSF